MVQICFSKEEKKELTSELRNKIEEAFKESFNYDGDGNDIENGDYDMFFYKTPLGLPINDDKPIIIEEEGDFGDLEQETTPQDILREYHATEYNIKILIDNSVGLGFITDKYLEALELEKKECRKALRCFEFDEYIKLM